MKTRSSRGLYAPELLEARIAPATFVVTSLLDDGGGAETTLREAIDLADADSKADSIVFQKGLTGTITLNGTQLEIDESVSIKGPGIDLITISGNNLSRIFHIDDGAAATIKTVSISGLTLIDGKGTGNGGAIYATESLALKNVVIASSTTTGLGGGLFALTVGKLSVTASLITGNHADFNAGGLYLAAREGIVLSKTTVSYNDATGTTGGVYLRNTGATHDVLVDTVLIANNSQAKGGGIQFGGPVEKKAVLKNSIITGNTSAGSAGGLYLDSGNLVVDKCIFSNNRASIGGAIGDNGAALLVIKNSRFLGNEATNVASLGGGALYLSGAHPVTITGSVFTGNHAEANGGAIFTASAGLVLNITGSTFTGNTADAFHGGAIMINADVTLGISASTFSGNTAGLIGGAISIDSAMPLTIKTSNFIGNSAGTNGGAIGGFAGVDIVITGGAFTENSGLSGGAIFITGAGGNAVDLSVTGTLFQANHATNDGGAIRSESDGIVLIKSAKFISNVAATGDGGGVYLDAPTAAASTRTIIGTLFRANIAGDDGGGMDLREASTVTSCLFIGNAADHFDGLGGGLRTIFGTTAITKSTFTGNFASDGGGIFDAGTATIDAASKVTGNAARTNPNKSGI